MLWPARPPAILVAHYTSWWRGSGGFAQRPRAPRGATQQAQGIPGAPGGPCPVQWSQGARNERGKTGKPPPCRRRRVSEPALGRWAPPANVVGTRPGGSGGTLARGAGLPSCWRRFNNPGAVSHTAGKLRAARIAPGRWPPQGARGRVAGSSAPIPRCWRRSTAAGSLRFSRGRPRGDRAVRGRPTRGAGEERPRARGRPRQVSGACPDGHASPTHPGGRQQGPGRGQGDRQGWGLRARRPRALSPHPQRGGTGWPGGCRPRAGRPPPRACATRRRPRNCAASRRRRSP